MEHSTINPASALRPVKRHIVSRDPTSGKAIYVDSPEQQYTFYPGFASVARSYATNSMPACLADDDDVRAYRSKEGSASYTRQEIVVPALESEVSPSRSSNTGGANLITLDLLPGAIGHWHQTVSLDFSICVVGEVIHELDSGEKVVLLPGDHIIQRATMHRWRNGSEDKPARILANILPCEPFRVAGKLVEEIHLPPGVDISDTT